MCAVPISRSEPGTAALQLVVNGRAVQLAPSPGATLLQVLRNDCGLNGPRYGCGLGGCGACTVRVDGRVARSCLIPAAAVAGRRIDTAEGLGTREQPHPVQQAFVDAQAAQCGYCTSGLLVATAALLERCPDPSDDEIRAALAHNLCRCGTHLEILAAVRLAAQRMASR